MEHFYGGGGNNNPDFTYRFLVKSLTNEMWRWCEDYPLNGPFERWHVKHRFRIEDDGDIGGRIERPLIQFESRKAAYMFRLTFSEYILEDLTYNFAKDDTWTT